MNNHPWFLPITLKLTYLVNHLPYKFKLHFLLFLGDGVVIVEKLHLRAFSNACTILEVNDNDSCMLLFINSLEGNATSLFANLPDECMSTWSELSYWFTSTFGHFDNPYEHLKRFNNLHMKDNESIHTFNLRFIKLHNCIAMNIRLPTWLPFYIIMIFYHLFTDGGWKKRMFKIWS